jgi:hypothetical protein
MPKEKSPFVGYTTEEVLASEAVTYIIQVGSDIFEARGTWFFTKKTARIHYGKILRAVLEQLNRGTKKEKEDAKRVLNNLKILPLRLH